MNRLGWNGAARGAAGQIIGPVLAGAAALTFASAAGSPAAAQLEVAVYLPLAVNRAQMDELPPPNTPHPTEKSTVRPSETPGEPASPTPGSTPSVTDAPSASPTPPSTPFLGTGTPSPSPTVDPGGCGEVPTFADGKTPYAVVHVATDGSDQTGDGSAARPYASIERAVDNVVPGTAIVVHAGRYAGGTYLSEIVGTADSPIWIGGAANEERPVLEGGSVGIHFVKVAYLVVHDIEIRGSANNGINCDDGGEYDNPLAAHHVVFRNLSIHDIGGSGNQDCLKLSGLNEFVVLDSSFASCGGGYSGSGIDHVGCHDGVIARNRFSNHSGNAIQAKGGSADIEIRWNHISNGGARALNMGGSTGYEYFRPPLDESAPNAEARRIHAFANVIEGGDTPFAFVGCVDCRAQHNTVIEPGVWLMRILQETTTVGGYEFEPARRAIVANNLFVFSRSRIRTYLNIGAGTEPTLFAFVSNLWYAQDDPSRSQPDLPTPELGAVVGLDPGLRDNFSIGHDSPAAGAGRSVDGPLGDFTGACWADPPSIGAFEASE